MAEARNKPRNTAQSAKGKVKEAAGKVDREPQARNERQDRPGQSQGEEDRREDQGQAPLSFRHFYKGGI